MYALNSGQEKGARLMASHFSNIEVTLSLPLVAPSETTPLNVHPVRRAWNLG